MQKKTISKMFQLLSLVAFVMLAMASSSSADAVKALDDFNDGYQYGRSLRSDINTDSVKNEDNKFDMADKNEKVSQQQDQTLL